MDNLPEPRPTTPPKEQDQFRRLLSPDEIKQKAMVDFAPQIASGFLTSEQVDEFIDKSVTGVEVNGVPVLCLDFEHTDDKIDSVMEAYIRSETTKDVVIEYFYPEICENARRAGLLNRMLAREKDVKTDWDGRLVYSRKMATLCAEAKKSVMVADLANKPSYLVSRMLLDNVLQIAALSILAAEKVIGLDAALVLYPALAIPGNLWALSQSTNRKKNRGIFDRDEAPRLDAYILAYEQARRMYVAKGIDQEIQKGQYDGEKDQVVVLYPKAHGIRIADTLLHPRPFSSKLKNLIYKTFGPTLDFATRTYEPRQVSNATPIPQNTLLGLPSDKMPTTDMPPEVYQWNLVSREKIVI